MCTMVYFVSPCLMVAVALLWVQDVVASVHMGLSPSSDISMEAGNIDTIRILGHAML